LFALTRDPDTFFLVQPITIEDILKGLRSGDVVSTIITQGEADLKVGGRSGVPLNPLAKRVTKTTTFKNLELAGPSTYTDKLAARGEVPAGQSPWYQWVADGHIRHAKNGNGYLACSPSPKTEVSVKYLVDGREATEDELKTIEAYKKASSPPDILLTLPFEKIAEIELQ